MKQSDQVRRKNVKRGKRKRTLSSKEGKNVKEKLDDVAPAKTDTSVPPPPPQVQPDEVESNSSGSSSKEDKGQPSDTRSETIFSNTLLNNVLNMKKKVKVL